MPRQNFNFFEFDSCKFVHAAVAPEVTRFILLLVTLILHWIYFTHVSVTNLIPLTTNLTHSLVFWAGISFPFKICWFPLARHRFPSNIQTHNTVVYLEESGFLGTYRHIVLIKPFLPQVLRCFLLGNFAGARRVQAENEQFSATLFCFQRRWGRSFKCILSTSYRFALLPLPALWRW